MEKPTIDFNKACGYCNYFFKAPQDPPTHVPWPSRTLLITSDALISTVAGKPNVYLSLPTDEPQYISHGTSPISDILYYKEKGPIVINDHITVDERINIIATVNSIVELIALIELHDDIKNPDSAYLMNVSPEWADTPNSCPSQTGRHVVSGKGWRGISFMELSTAPPNSPAMKARFNTSIFLMPPYTPTAKPNMWSAKVMDFPEISSLHLPQEGSIYFYNYCSYDSARGEHVIQANKGDKTCFIAVRWGNWQL